jgi:hypothetical protein
MFAPERMRIVHGLVVGAFAGMIHGMEPSFPSLPDALCFPHDDIFVGRGALRPRLRPGLRARLRRHDRDSRKSRQTSDDAKPDDERGCHAHGSNRRRNPVTMEA